MSRALMRRGPDGHGIWHEGSAGLVHRRLAIVDLSPAGAQPMISRDGRYVVTFNGEIFNYLELRSELSDISFYSGSDTEVLLALYAKDGESMLKKLRGMFSFAIWDTQEHALFFARDQIGKKPFFYTHNDESFIFASEIKALLSLESSVIDDESIKLFLGLQYVPSPKTGFKNIFSLEPGHCGTWRDGKLAIRSYVSPILVEDPGFDRAAKNVRQLLEESVRLRLIADVPIGIFLSGGVDSSAIAALAHAQGASLASFTLGFNERAFDERDEAEGLAQHFGFEHHSFLAKPQDLLEVADTVIDYYDAPYADSSSLNTWILARETKLFVKAVLTGDGGDELFGGYRRYRYFSQALRLKNLGLSHITAQVAQSVGRILGDNRYERFAETLVGGYPSLFCSSYFLQPEAMNFIRERLNTQLDPVEAAMDFDLRSYLPDDLNVKMDRATMAHGLEARCPILDQELVAYVTQLPASYRFQSHTMKPLLVEAVKDLLPSNVLRRPKRGFQVPLAAWFRGPLRSAFIERCIQSIKVQAYIPKSRIEQLLLENDRGVDHGNRLWMLYSLATWLQKYG